MKERVFDPSECVAPIEVVVRADAYVVCEGAADAKGAIVTLDATTLATKSRVGLSFMDAPAPWTADDEDARAMWAYLASLPGSAAPAPFTPLVREADLPPGDPASGKTLFAVTCAPCHGAVHSGEGRAATFVPRLPDDVDAAHTTLALADRRLVYLRKVREGAFRDGAGSMPPFSREVLADAEVAAILAFLGQY